MGVQSAATTGASRNRIGACTRGPASWADLAAGVVQGRNRFIPSLNGSRANDDGRVVRDFKLEPTTREV